MLGISSHFKKTGNYTLIAIKRQDSGILNMPVYSLFRAKRDTPKE